MSDLIDSEAAKELERDHGDEFAPLAMLGFNCTELGNAERMVARFRGRIRYCYARNRWLIWDKQRWRWDPGGVIQRVAQRVVRGIYHEAAAEHLDKNERTELLRHAKASEKNSSVAAMVKWAQSQDGVSVELDSLDSDPLLLNCENGTVDLRTGALRSPLASDLITKMCPVAYDPAAQHETWSKFLAEAIPDLELAAYVQRAAGYAIQGAATERALFFLHGLPGSAKSTAIDALGAALGDYHVPTSPETWLVQKNPGGNRGDLVRLAGARLVTATEFRQRAQFDEALIKSVTGGDMITAAAKYEAEVSFRPTFALWFAANDAPAIRDDDAGMWARMRRIPFDHVIPPECQDKAIKEQLKENPACRAAALAWAVAGCLEWQKSGLGSAVAIEKSNREYQADMDPVGEFFDDRLQWGAPESVGQGALRKAYEAWCKEVGVHHALDRKQFEKRVNARGGKYVIVRGKRYVTGVRLLGEWEENGV